MSFIWSSSDEFANVFSNLLFHPYIWPARQSSPPQHPAPEPPRMMPWGDLSIGAHVQVMAPIAQVCRLKALGVDDSDLQIASFWMQPCHSTVAAHHTVARWLRARSHRYSAWHVAFEHPSKDFCRVSFKVHDSQPYRSTDSTVAWKKLSLILRERLDFRTLFMPFSALKANAFNVL